MKILITGCHGQLGTELQKQLADEECALGPLPERLRKATVIAVDVDELDITDREATVTYIRRIQPDTVINCAAFTNVDGCETNRDAAYRVNALAPRNLALAADALGAKMVQFSTDDVFAKASHHPYNEFDAPAPESLYGKSKLAGEEFVRTLCHRYLIVRSAWVYGIGRDFVSTVLNAAADPTCPWLAVPTDRFASPTSADDLTAAVEQLIDHDTLGIYHIVCQGRCSRYDFAQAILKAAHMEDKLELHPIRAADAGSTPSYTVLDNLMLRLDNLPQPRPWKEALNEYINSLQ